MDEKLERVLNRILSGDTEAAFGHLLKEYYEHVVLEMNDYNENPYETMFPEELCLPLDERSSGIVEALNILVENGFDINEENSHYDPPMMYAVPFADAYITQFLILHGANTDVYFDDDDEPPELHTNYYLDEIDIAWLNHCWGNPDTEKYRHALLETACSIARDGHIDSYAGFCLLIKDHMVSLGSPDLAY